MSVPIGPRTTLKRVFGVYSHGVLLQQTRAPFRVAAVLIVDGTVREGQRREATAGPVRSIRAQGKAPPS